MNDAPLRDRAEREAALDATRSFIVQAPAGSGKTELLIQRYLALLARVERPEAIVAMTFTRKAAGEIRDRILRALRGEESRADAPNRALMRRLAGAVRERDAALGWNLVDHPARLQVHTIDALAMALARQAPLTAKVGALPRPVDNAEGLYTEAAREEFLSAELDDGAWRRLLEHLDNDAEKAVRLIARLLAKREQWLPHIVGVEPRALRAVLERALEAEIASELALLDDILPSSMRAPLAALMHYAARNLAAEGVHPLVACADRTRLPPTSADGLEHWQAIAAWLLTGRGAFLRSVNKNQGFPAAGAREREAGERSARKAAMEALLRDLAAVPGLERAMRIVRSLPPPRYADASWSFVEALLVVLPRAAARLRLVFARRGAMDFNEATILALDALRTGGGPSDLLIALDTRLEHLLVDEFQDTSFVQVELIRQLTAGWSAGDGRTLFLVGDPMQSIYRFRDANVSLFLRARERRAVGGIALEALVLASNFRSQPALVEWVNRVFPQLLPDRDDPVRGSVAFAPSYAALDERSTPDVTVDLAVDDRREADAVIARIRAALATRAKTIGVLVRKRADLEEILPALRAAGMGYAAVELDRLSERQAVLDLAALTHALVQPDDRAAWLAILRAPWCALLLPDLFALVESSGERPLADAIGGDNAAEALSRLSADGRTRFERFRAAVAPALADRGRVGLANAVRGAWLALGGPACVAEPSVDLPAAERVLALIAEHAVGADLPEWSAFQAALETLYAEGQGDAATRVSIMTLHKAKGLEFDVVVMPGLARNPGTGDSSMLLWREREQGVLLAPIPPRARAEDEPVYGYLRSLQRDEEDAESRRLLYVGCTRAKLSLHLAAVLPIDHDADGHPQWKTPAKGTLLAALWPMLKLPPAVSDATKAPRERITGIPLTRLPLSWRPPSPPPSVPVASEPESRAAPEPIEFDWARETARRIGTVAHRLLRRIAAEGVERWTPERIAKLRPRAERELAHVGLSGAEARAAVDDVLAALKGTLADARGRWLFDPRHLDARSEYAVTQWQEGEFVHRVLDRTFVDPDGIRWIVDFKLSRHEGAGLDDFLDRERARYAGQLEGYARAIRALEDRPIRLGLYFPLLHGWREWSFSP